MKETKLLMRGLWLEYATLAWNVVGCLIVLFAAFAAKSVALAGFGIDSVIEIFASIIVIWQLKSINKDKEQFAERLIGIAFLLLAIYISVQSLFVLLSGFHSLTSTTGIVWLVLTVIVMFSLAYGKGKVGKALGNPVLLKESKVTIIDGLLAVSVLIGILLNTLFGLWWADPLAGFVIVYYGVKEGFHAIKA
jgi:divalent metal cation (Fe/Co/Zn/Cd) transporter